MIKDLMYIELKSGYFDDGPAWIGYVKVSKSKRTIYFNGHAFQKSRDYYSNYVDVETGEKYWISGLKKNECNRHWAGHGKVFVDNRAVEEYLRFIGEKELNKNQYETVEIEDDLSNEQINQIFNSKELE